MPLRSAAISRQHSHRLFSPQIVAPSRSCIVVSRAQRIVKVQRRLHFFFASRSAARPYDGNSAGKRYFNSLYCCDLVFVCGRL